MRLLSKQELQSLHPAEVAALDAPIPTQIVSSDEFLPIPQTLKQREVEARLKVLAGELAHRHGMSRRRFFRTAAGMAAAFLAMNDVYGPLFEVSRAEAAEPDRADERADGLSGQFIIDGHTHFLRDDTRLEGFARMREAVGKAGWNPGLTGKPQTLDDLKFDNYIKEIFLDSDTKIALISSAPSDIPEDWFLTNPMAAKARARVNDIFGGRRMLSHAIFTPGQLDVYRGQGRAAERQASQGMVSQGRRTGIRQRPKQPRPDVCEGTGGRPGQGAGVQVVEPGCRIRRR